ncbi:alpha/beta fold hydrolase [Nocardioides sp. JQ2195]|uniref:alpha/beta fold hydrolase n=1 Tax=Nocardioides sp. JQ2195 TaxID=2592334 RepID=UPI00143E4B33|nr:alpha/beta fold hydrolase [Nocardioides sp. JQ2195]QIX28424.1 alpha/beta fold hydrolase [Nocardioides sp. JQ2195]
MTAPVVLISPAMAIGSGYYRLLVEELESRGWAAQALTRRGFEADGRRASREHDWSYADEIDDIEDAVAKARAEHPARPVQLLGHSLGGQLVVGHELNRTPVDGVITVGASLPHHRHHPFGGPHLVVMGGLIVPVLTTLFGHLPKPAFGAPGARTMMREWGRMVLTGRTPYRSDKRVTTPSLVISLEDDTMAPVGSVDAFAQRLFEREAVTRWHYRNDDVLPDNSNDHIGWARGSRQVVDRIVEWWSRVNR